MVGRTVGSQLEVNEKKNIWMVEKKCKHGDNVPLMSDGVIHSSIIGYHEDWPDHLWPNLEHLHELGCMARTVARLENGIFDTDLRYSSVETSTHAIRNFMDKSHTGAEVGFMK